MSNNTFKILVIDDLQDNLITMNALIKDAFPEAKVFMAKNGKTGLKLAAKEKPDVILLDILMSGMDGYEVCQILKADAELCDIPVVFVTAIEINKEAMVKALESGGESFITKPIDEIDLMVNIRSMLKIKKANDAKKDENERLEKLVEKRSKELFKELEEHKKTLNELKIREAEKSAILQTAIDGFWIVDKQGNFLEVNDAACEMTGYSKEEMLKMSIQNIEAKETAVETANHMKTVIKEGSARFETQHRTKEGRIIDVEVSTTWMNSLNIFFSFLNDITERKHIEEVLEKRIVALIQPLESSVEITFEELFNVADIQKLQDQFAEATGVASIIAKTDGVPITKPSNFCRLCNDIIRNTEKGLKNCYKSDAELGKFNPKGPSIKPCLSGGLWDAGAAITVSGKHIANWLIGQVRDETQSDEKMKAYAKEIGADEDSVIKAFHEVPSMSKEQFEKVAQALYTLSNQLSASAYQNVQQARFINERKQMNDKLKDSAALLNETAMTAKVGGWKINLDGETLAWTNETFRIHELDQGDQPDVEEAINYYHPDDREMVGEAVQKSVETGEPFDFEARLITALGNQKWVRAKGNSIIMPGKEKVIQGIIQDISERKHAEEQLLQQQYYLKKSQELGKLGSWELDIKENILQWSDENCRIFGVQPGSIVNYELFISKVHPKDRDYVNSEWLASVAGKPYDIEHRLLINGVTTWVREKADITFDENGVAVSAIGFTQDITERKQAVEELKESEERFHLAMNASNDGLFDWDLITNEIYYSPGWKKMIGYKDHELPNDFSVWENTTAPEDVKKSWELQQKLISKQIDRFVLEFKMKHKDGHWVDILSRARAIFDEEGMAIRIVGTHTDISERKLTEEANIRLKDFNESIVTNLAEGIILENDDGIIQFANPAMVKMLGYKEGELVGKHWKCFVPDDQIEVVKNANERRKKGKSDQYEMELIRKDGERIFVLVGGVPNTNKGAYIGLLAAFTDITMRKQAEEELRKLSTAIMQSPSVITITDTEGKLEYVNPKFTEITGYSQEEAMGQNPRILKSEEQNEEEYKKLWKTISSGNVWRGQFHNKKKNGELFWEMASISPILDKNGNIVNYIKVSEDITDKIEKEKALEKSLLELNVAQKVAKIGSWYWDLESNEIEWSEEMYDIYGFNQKQKDKTSAINEIIHPEDAHILRDALSTVLNEDMPSGIEYRIIRKDGKMIYIGANTSQIRNSEGEIIALVGTAQDITQHKEAAQALIAAKEKAEESDRLKSAFLTNMSHEIRTPMNGILGFTELLKEPQLTGDTKKKYIQVIEKSGNRMLNTINDIIDISRIEAGEVRVTKTEVSVNKILEEQFNFFQREAKSKGLELYYNPSLKERESRIITDPHKLDSILTNLLKNAIKYTETGQITMGCSIVDEENGKFMEFYVKDTGIGIPANRVEAIFNRFEQADIGDTRAFEGSGLGLAISKSYVEMIGGMIEVTSKEGSGSTFSFCIPYNKKNSAEDDADKNNDKEPDASLNNLSVIIAEDDETSSMFLKTILEDHVKHLTLTTTGKETIKLLHNNPDTDIILMDIRMPDMNGYDATCEIRKFNKNVIIIAQTAYGMSGDKEKALEAGCDDYVAKPIRKDKLFKKIQECLVNLNRQ